MPSVAKSPVSAGQQTYAVVSGQGVMAGRASLAEVIDCYTRELLGWHL